MHFQLLVLFWLNKRHFPCAPSWGGRLHATLRLLLSEILDQFPSKATEFTTALWQRHHYKRVTLFCSTVSH